MASMSSTVWGLRKVKGSPRLAEMACELCKALQPQERKGEGRMWLHKHNPHIHVLFQF